ncbi:MAG: apolipoprotein N-acyltransferase [Gammaproteobacteria bacterium]|nr:apolipoprotein N-acyltransferase [Gammaproteobacteria bacterium]
MSAILRTLTVLGAGAVLPLALAPFGIVPFMLVSAGALFWILRRTATPVGAFWGGWWFGVGKYGVGASWIYVSIHVFGAAPPPLAVALVALFVAGMALFTGVLGLVYHRVAASGRRGGGIVEALAFATLWTALEWVLTWFLTGFPWLFAGYAFIDTPLAGLAPVTGVLGMSFVAVLTAACLVILPAQDSTRRRVLVLAAPAALWVAAWSLQSVAWTERGASRSVALVQANVPQDAKWNRDRLPEWKARYGELTARARSRDIVVWPEAAIPDYYHLAKVFIDDTVQTLSGDLVQGTVLAEVDEGGTLTVYNAAVSSAGGIYRKRRLVPFGDYVPFESALRGLIAFFDLPMSRGTPGAEPQPHLKAAGWNLAMAICYEIAYPKAVAEHGRDADVLVTVSNDTWFGSSIGPLQHAQMARMRAIENGKYLLRATNNGVTALIDDRGAVVAELPQFEQGVLTGTVQATSGSTPFARFLNAPLLGVLAIVAVGLVTVSVRRGRGAIHG